jgi:hypothetical protein
MKSISFLIGSVLFLNVTLTGCSGSASQDVKQAEKLKQTQENKVSSVPSSTEPEPEQTKEVLPTVKPSKDSRQLTMVFDGYEEGDYPHFLFTDVKTGEGYDFRFLNENDLSGVPILLDDENAAFGYRANPKYLNKTFLVEIVKKSVLDSDLEGNTIKSKAWVIASIQPN